MNVLIMAHIDKMNKKRPYIKCYCDVLNEQLMLLSYAILITINECGFYVKTNIVLCTFFIY
jgi:hypothetical protein